MKEDEATSKKYRKKIGFIIPVLISFDLKIFILMYILHSRKIIITDTKFIIIKKGDTDRYKIMLTKKNDIELY